MTNLQETEFKLLKLFVEICEQLDLRYYLVCGSALGAEKYGGFIPWDDDVDVALPRDDYERFISQAHRYLPEDVFLQNYHTQRTVPFIFSKLRDSNTTYIENSHRRLDIHHGVYIDIFPLDGLPESKAAQKILNLRKRLLSIRLNCVYDVDRKGAMKYICAVERFFGMHKRTLNAVKRLDKILSKTPVTASSVWCNHANWQGTKEYAPREQYGKGKKGKFENLDIILPELTDAYLEQKYGDWRADLPEEEKVGHHYADIIDLTRSYKEYEKEEAFP